jgi:hypothetical protein
MGKERTSLDVAIAYELKAAALRENRGFIVERSVFEMKDQVCSDPISVHKLNQVAHRKHAT